MARTTTVSNKVSWSQRGSSHRSSTVKHFNCSLDFNLTFIDWQSCCPPMLFWRRCKFFIDYLTTSKLKVPSNMVLENIEFKPPWTFLEAVLFTLWLCCVFPFHRSELHPSSQNSRQDLFQKWKLYQQMGSPSWLLLISGLILMRVIRLSNGKPCRCYHTCGHIIFMTWVISLNDALVIRRYND